MAHEHCSTKKLLTLFSSQHIQLRGLVRDSASIKQAVERRAWKAKQEPPPYNNELDKATSSIIVGLWLASRIIHSINQGKAALLASNCLYLTNYNCIFQYDLGYIWFP